MEIEPTPFQKALEHSLNKAGWGGQTDLAKAVDLSQQMISALVKGGADGSESTRRAIAAYYGYEYDDFLKFGEKLIKGVVETSGGLSISAISGKIQKYDRKPEIKDLLAKAREILESGTPWADNMRMNIISTHTIFKSEQATGKKSG